MTSNPETAAAEQALESFRDRLRTLDAEIHKVIVGQGDVIEHVLIALVAGGHVLLEGVPGLGKTLLVRTLSQALGVSFARIQFTPDLMPADITGTNIVVEREDGTRKFRFQKGPIFANVVLTDEINRATPKTQSALLEAMQEGAVTFAGRRHALPSPFFVLATQNPIEMEGTYPLPEAQLDRFLFKIIVPFPAREDLLAVIHRTTGPAEAAVRPVLDGPSLLELRTLARNVLIAGPVEEYAADLVLATHPGSPHAPEAVKRCVRYGASPRAGQALVLAGKVRALMKGRCNVAFDDIRRAAHPSLRHRIILNFEGEAEGLTTDRILDDVVAAVREPR